jgi:hypothetical protein
MAFEISIITAREQSPIPVESRCFCCNAELKTAADGPLVAYDAYPTSNGIARVLMHRDCAFAMAQRIICDAWPKRRVGEELMKNDK